MGLQISHLHVRRATFIHADTSAIWAEFINFDSFKVWFGVGHNLETYEPDLKGRIRLSVESEGQRRYFGGRIIVFEAERELSFRNNWEKDPWPVDTFLTLRLNPLYDGTSVELFHHGFERLGAAAATHLAGYEGGWNNQHLENLRNIVEAR